MPQRLGAFSERISRAADDTFLSVVSAVVVSVMTALGLLAMYLLARLIGLPWFS